LYFDFWTVAAWLNFLGGANYEIGAPGIFVLNCALHHLVKILNCKSSDWLKVTPGISELTNFYLYEGGDNDNAISISLLFPGLYSPLKING